MGFLKGRIEDYSSPLAGVPARLYAGYFFLKYGLHKATTEIDPPQIRKIGGELEKTLLAWSTGTRYPFYIPFLTKVAIPHAGVFAVLVTFGEIAVGTALLLGFAARLASLGGLFLCLNFLLASGTPLLSVEQPVVFALLLLTTYATAAGRTLGLDYLLKRRLPPWAA